MKRVILGTTILLLLSSGVLLSEEATKENVAGLYVATFDRAPDGAGLDYWVEKSDLSLEGIATSFFEQNETKELYPDGLDETDFIVSVYDNTFDRAGDEAGVDYWRKGLRDGSLSKQQFILAVLNGAKGEDRALLENKTDVGLAFAESNETDVSLAKDLMIDISADRGSIVGSLNKLYAHVAHANEHAFTNNYTLGEDGTIISKDKSIKNILKKPKKDKIPESEKPEVDVDMVEKPEIPERPEVDIDMVEKPEIPEYNMPDIDKSEMPERPEVPSHGKKPA
ncbi:MAG: DUF4214 domain-containing protein [Sulfurovum sp.]|nr:DUF4214 domain-containing protein [Sulfurovaceae bacterium]